MPALIAFGDAPFGGIESPPSPPEPPPPTTISTSNGTLFVDAPTVTVATCAIIDGDYAVIDHLYCDRIRISVAPAIGQAILTWNYGKFMAPGTTQFADVAPLSINGLFVRIEVQNNWATVGYTNLGEWDADENDPELESGIGETRTFYKVSVSGTTEIDGINNWKLGDFIYFDGTTWQRAAVIRWYGIAEVDTLTPNGNSSGISSGRQTITCYDLKRLLEKEIVATAVIETAELAGSAIPDEFITINRGLTFNMDERGNYKEHGNRSHERLQESGDDGTHVFSYEERGADEWSAQDAVEYLLHHHNPFTVEPTLVVDSGDLSWNPKGGVKTDRRSVKAILDEMIARHRGVSYYIDFDGEQLSLVVFSFSDVDIEMPNGTTFTANPDQYSLDFEAAFDITSCSVSNLKTSQFHKIIVEGDWRTTTCTLSLHPPYKQLIGDWTEQEEDNYWVAASNNANYQTLNDKQKREANREARRQEKFKHIFSRFVLSSDWDLTTQLFNASVMPQLDLHNGNGAFLTDAETGEVIDCETWIAGLTLLDHLPLRERYDYSGDKIESREWQNTVEDLTTLPPFLEPFGFILTSASRYELLDKLDSNSEEHGPKKRKWAVNTKVHHDRPAVTLDVIKGKQQFFATRLWRDQYDLNRIRIVPFDVEDDPSKNDGLTFTDVYMTLTIEMTERARIERIISMPVTGEQERVLRIHVEDCRLDYVVPDTTVAIIKGKTVRSEGGFVRDDRQRLDTFAKAAEAWYGTERQTLDLTFRQIREIVSLGYLITDVGSTYQKTDINSVVTAITYDFLQQTTQFETSFIELDLLN